MFVFALGVIAGILVAILAFFAWCASTMVMLDGGDA